MGRYQSVQYLRGIAATMVVYFHFLTHLARSGTGALPDDIKVGAAGVDVFFVISGFVMWVTTYGRSMTPGQFWARRVVRIVPLYWSFTISLAVLAVIAPVASRTDLDFGHLLTSLLFIPDIHPFKDGEIWPLLIPGWTLNLEMYFYLIFGGCLFFAKEYRLRILAFWFVGAVLAGQVLGYTNPIMFAYSSLIVLEFLMGAVLGHLVIRGRTASSPVALLLAVLSVIYLAANATLQPDSVERIYIWGLPSFLLVYAFLSLEQNGWKFENRILLALGDSSYALYLSHIFTLGAIGFIWTNSGIKSVALDIVMHFVALTLSGFTAFMVWKYYEVPLIRIVRRIFPAWARYGTRKLAGARKDN